MCVQARENLEFSLVSEADMVFTTLSSTGRRNIFSKLENAFETVLVDEAAQASEIAVLQPLLFGCKRWVAPGGGACRLCPPETVHGLQAMGAALPWLHAA